MFRADRRGELVGRLGGKLAFLILLGTSSIACDRRPPNGTTRVMEGANGEDFASGTVGEAVSERTLTMPAVRTWYAAMAEIAVAAEQRRTKVSLDFPLDGQLADQAARIDSMPLLHDALGRCAMTSREFVVLTSAVGAVRLSLTLVDSLGEAGRPSNIGESVLLFARQHRREIDSLEATLRK